MDWWKFAQEHPEAVVATGALIVSLAATVVLIIQTRSADAHNRISVKPVIRWREAEGKAECRDAAGNFVGIQARWELLVMNLGLGPAHILEYVLRRDDTEMPLDLFKLREIVEELLAYAGANIVELQAWQTAKSWWLKAGDAQFAMIVVFRVPTEGGYKVARGHLKRFSIGAKYASVYGDVDNMDSRHGT
jgi:hypothetical protein